ncbi:hypothetical protein ACIP79_40830 [Streptomyces sp. NPDC088747]|uniref:hypothetical protein n=1 Tax=Streptomyces sp. NPDC088747 TaxID=3365886 RepID=UPI003806A25F
MEIWEVGVLLAGPVVLATAAVIIASLALKDTASQDRANILYAIAELMRGLRGRR